MALELIKSRASCLTGRFDSLNATRTFNGTYAEEINCNNRLDVVDQQSDNTRLSVVLQRKGCSAKGAATSICTHTHTCMRTHTHIQWHTFVFFQRVCSYAHTLKLERVHTHIQDTFNGTYAKEINCNNRFDVASDTLGSVMHTRAPMYTHAHSTAQTERS